MPVGPGQGNGTGGAKGIKGTVASADFGNGVATEGKGHGGAVAPADSGKSRSACRTEDPQADAGPAPSG